MSIYTKKGDKGETGLFVSGKPSKRISKSSLIVDALGAIDELNSYLGVVKQKSPYAEMSTLIEDVQENLLTIGSITAGSKLSFSKSKTTILEKEIDKMDKELIKLTNFIIPGGGKLSAHLHFARSLSRRAERRLVSLSERQTIKPQILIYMNRLSDFLFTLARMANLKAGVKDEVWKFKK